MASHLLKNSKFPAGTSVGVYLATQRAISDPNGTPYGSAIQSATVAADSSLLFTGLADDTDYVAYAATFGYVTFRTVNQREDQGAQQRLPEPRQDGKARLWNPGGAIETNIPRTDAVANVAPLASGTLFLTGGAVLPAGQTVSRVGFVSGTTAAGTPTNQWFVIVRQSDLAVLGKTADDTTTAWAANTVKELALATPLVPADDTPVWLGILVAAATPPSLLGVALANVILSNMLTAPVLSGASNTGLTVPSGLGATATAPTGNVNVPLAFVR